MNNTNSAKTNQFFIVPKIIFIVLAGLVLPLLLISLIKFTGYSEIIEEIVKVLVVLFLILKLPTWKAQIFGGIIFGLLFSVSENIFYLNNIFQLGDFSIFWQRFLWTTPMHIITVLVMVFAGLAGKRWIVLGLGGAIILHVLFNVTVVGLLM
ncbi:MAG: PrsW family glutamic-type intramembrane protease [Patescibacteria group bacterium]|nr:PrsW family glutamic-type intramembrane protease [Patescibacteria group bacterium]